MGGADWREPVSCLTLPPKPEGRVGHHTQPAEREQQTILHTDCIRLLRLHINLLPFIYEVSGHRQRRRFIASRYVGLVVMVSAFALIVRNATFASFAQNGHCWRIQLHNPLSESCKRRGACCSRRRTIPEVRQSLQIDCACDSHIL